MPNTKNISRLALLVCFAAFFLGPSLAQQRQDSKTAPQAGPGPAVRVTTRLVQVNVVVHNSKGEPVSGLKKEDFLLFDKGQPEQIALFSAQTTEDRTQPASALPANTFSNRIEERTNAPTSVTVILLDELNTRFQDSSYARTETVKLLRQIQPQDRVALYLLRGNLTILHDFTSDARALLAALERHRSGHSAHLDAGTPQPPDTGDAELDAWLEGANERTSDFYNTDRAYRTLGAMEGIGRHLARVPGRKNLIWISGSFPIWFGMDREPIQGMLSRNRQTFTQEVEQAGRALSDSNVAVYPVDARGLIGPFGLNPNFNSPRIGAARPPSSDPWGLQAVGDTHATMNMIADRTGGRAFYNTNDIQGSIRRAINDSRVTYVLGFYPTHQKWDGQFRPIKVQLQRGHAGAQLRYRKGYVAAAQNQETPEARTAALREAATGPLDAGAIGLTVRARPAIAAGTETVVLDLRMEPRDVLLTQTSGAYRGSLTLLFLQRGADGSVLARRDHALNLNLDADAFKETMAEGIKARKHLGVAPRATELRIVVRDTATGALGSVSIPVQKVLQADQPKAH